MPEISRQHVDRLAKIAAALSALASDLAGGTIEPDEPIRSAVAAKVAKRQCLICGDVIPLEKRYSRGNCAPCGQNVRNSILRGETSQSELILFGAVASEKKNGGRRLSREVIPISDLVARLRSREPVHLAESLAAQSRKKKAEQNPEQKKEPETKKPRK